MTMKKHYEILFLAVFCTIKTAFGQITTVPASSGGVVSICQNGSVIFSTTNTPPAGATISWSFPGGVPSSANTIGPHAVAYATPGTYTATLTIDGASSSVNVNVAANSITPPLSISNNLLQFGYGQTPVDTDQPDFYYCGNLLGAYNGNVSFQFVLSSAYPADHQIIVNWGDGTSSTFPGNTTTFNKTYNCSVQTEFVMSFSVVAPNGCVAAASYDIFSGIAPQISVSGNAGTHCMPDPYTFTFLTNGVPGTTYTYQFSDGSPITEISGPFPTQISHEFLIHSCNQTSFITGPNGVPQTFPNSYAGNLIGTNVCGTTFLSIGPIYVSTEPIPIIEVSPTTGYACVEQPVTITNASIPGVMVSAGICNELNKFCYNITPSTGWTLVSGNMGDCSDPNWFFWSDNATTDIVVTFQEYGTYYVELIQANACGTVSIMDSICVVAPIQANFTTNVLSGCSPLVVHTTNTPYTPSCTQNDAVYSWAINNASLGNCPNEGLFPSYVFGTNSSSFEPSFLFEYPGIFNIILNATLTNPIPGTLCNSSSHTVQVTISNEPNMTFDTYNVCVGDPLQLTNELQNCYAQATTINWSFPSPPASQSSSTIQQPTLTFSAPGNYNANVTVTNECGSANFTAPINVSLAPIVTLSGPPSLCVNLPATLSASIVGPATQGVWTVSPPLTGLVPNGLNATFNPPLNFIGNVTFTFTTTDAPIECGQVSSSFTVSYDSDATANAGSDMNACLNGSVTLNGSIGGSASSATWSSSGGGTFSNPTSLTSTFTPPAGFTGNITLTLTTDDPPGACQQASDQVVITVVQPPVINITSDVQMCQGTTMPVSASATGFQSGVLWTSPNGTFTPSSTAFSTNFVPTPSFNGQTTITATTTGASPCPDASQTINITVHPSPTVIFSEQNQTICSGGGTIPVTLSSNTPDVSITWSMVVPNNTTGLGAPGSTQSGTTTIPSYNSVINTTPDPIIVTFNVQASSTISSFCPSQLIPYTITILPNPTINAVNNVLTCSGDQVQPINFVGTGNSFEWIVTLPSGAPSIGLSSGQGMNTPLFTATNTTTSPIIANVQVTPIFTGNNLGCVGGTSNFTITVNPQGQVNDVPNLLVCNSTSVPAIVFTTNNSGGTTTYNWVNNGDAIGITSANTNVTIIQSFTAVNPGASPLVASIDVIPIYSSGGLSCPGPSDNFSITVAPTPLVNPTQDITICSQFQQPQITFNGTGTSYEWSADTNPPVVGNFPSSGTNSIPSFLSINTPTNVSNTFVVTPIYTIGSLNCLGTPSSFDITVLFNPVVDQLPNIVICNAECVNPIPFVGTGNNYTWTITNPSIGTDPSGSGQAFPNFCGVNNNTLLVPETGTVTYIPQIIQNGVTCNGTASQFQIIVNPTPSVTPIDDIILCNGNSSNPITISGTASTYSWQINNTSVGVGLPPSGVNVIPAILGYNNSNSQTNNAVITITPQFSGSGLACPGVPFELDVIIYPIPEVNPVADQTLCFQSQSGPIAFTGTGTSYNWSSSGTPSIGLPIQSGQNSLPTFTATNSTNIPISNVIQVTPVFTTGNLSCFGTPMSFEIFVLPNPTIAQEPLASVCNSQPTVPVNYQGTFSSYTWTIAPNPSLGINAPISGTGNLPSFTWTNTDNANEHAAEITVLPFFTFNGLSCQGASMTHSISVLPTTVVTPLPNLVFCNGDSSAQFPINTTGNSVVWSSSVDVGITSGTTFFIPDFIATNTDMSQNAPSLVSTVTITPSYTNVLGLTCQGTSSSFNITVHPSPYITPISNYTVCNFGTVQQTLSTNIPADFFWSSSVNAFIQGNQTTVQNTNIISNGLVNISPYPGTPQQTTYTVNAVSIPHGCNAVPMQFVVNLMPTVIMTSPSNYEICSGNVVGATFDSNVPSTYTWVAQPPQGVDGATVFPPVTSPIINDILFNVTNPPTNALVVYNVTPTSIDGSCLGINQTILVTVTPPPSLVSSPTMSMCSGQFVNYNFVANTNATFAWFGQNNPNVTGITLNTTNSPVITDQLVNLTGIPQQVTYIVIITATVSGGNCSSQPIPVTITVNPLPQVVPLTKEICPNETVTFLLQASEPSYFTWVAENNINVTGETLIPVQSNFIQNTLTNSTYDPQYVYYNVTPTSSSTGCIGPTVQHIAIVNPIPNLTFEMSDILCTENPVTYTINPSTPLNVLWDLGNMVQSNIYNPTTYYHQPGTYIVTLYGINPITGCENTIFVPVEILLAPPVDFISSSTKECVPAFFQFTNTAQNQGSVLQWDFGDGTISNEQGVADHFYQEAGCYDVTLTAVAPNGCPNSITYEDMVCAYNIPIAGFIVNDPIQYGDVNEFLFENLTVFGHTYHWDLGDGTTTNAVHPGHIYPIQRNIYNVMLIAYNEAGCSDTAMYSIQVQERLIFYVPNTFTPNGNTRNELFQPIFTSGYDIYSYELMIFNRWGEILFESYNDKVGWDGTYGGVLLPQDTYVWRIRFKLLDDDDYQEYYGHVNLLR
jgi:gliding motility-associated-like protein